MKSLSLTEARRQVELLTGSPDADVCLRLIHDSDKSAPATKLEGKLGDLWPRVERAQASGEGVFVIPNPGGHEDSDISGVRALFVDADDAPEPVEWHETPDFLVRRDATHWHAYWLVPDLPVAEFKAAQRRLAAHYGTDVKVCNPSRVMRLAGTLHLKDPANPRSVELADLTAGADHWELGRPAARLLAALPAVKSAAVPAGPTDHAPDLPANVARAERYLRDCVERGHVAVQDEGGNTATLVMACTLRDLGVSDTTAFRLLSEVWNPACRPAWEEDELQVIVSNAYRYAQNGAGAWAVGPSSEVFAPILGSLGLDKEDAPDRDPFKFWTPAEVDALPPPSWLIPDMVPDKGLTLIYGQPKTYKSFITLALTCELARQGKRVAYIAGEGFRPLRLRQIAWEMLNELDGPPPGFWFIGNMPLAIEPSQVDRFITNGRPHKPDVVVIDTVARSMFGLNENDAKDMGMLVAAAERIQRALDCAVIMIHHTPKDGGLPRGSGALVAAIDAMHEIVADKPTMAVAMHARAMKDGAERDQPWTWHGRTLGPSIAFSPTTASEHRLLTHVEDVASPRRVGAALRELGAVGDENGVATRVLAAALVPPDETQSPEAREQAVGRLARALAARASGALEAYALGEGRERSWCLPGA